MFRWIKIIGLMLAGAVVGPLLVAVAVALYPSSQRDATAAFDLLKEYDARDTTIAMPSRFLSQTADDCGYAPDKVFTEQDQNNFPMLGTHWQWTPHAGYFALILFQAEDWHQRLDVLRSQHLEAATSHFSARFLRQCMRGTALAPLCAQRTRTLLGDWHSPHSGPATAQLDNDGEYGVICAYLDGVAARRGLPLAKR